MNIDPSISIQKPHAKRGEKLDNAQKLKLEKAVREFESVFVGYLLKSMRNTVQKADNQTDTFGADILEGMFDVELAKHVSKSSNLGLAEMLYRRMTDEELPKPARSANPPAQVVAPKQTAASSAIVAKEHPAVVKNPVKVETKINPVVQPTRVHVASKPVENIVQPVSVKIPTAVASRDAIAVKSADVNATKENSSVNRVIERRLKKYDEFIAEAADKHGISQNLIKAVIASESAGRPNTQSPQDAKGLMQLIDSTATAMGVKNVWDPRENIMGGAKYLKHLLNRFDGDEKLAIASYNAGPGNVVKHGGIPPFKETKAYVARVMNFLQAFAEQEDNQ